MTDKDSIRILLSVSAQLLLCEPSVARRNKSTPDPGEDLSEVRKRVARKLSDMLEDNDLREEADAQRFALNSPRLGETLFGLRAWVDTYDRL